MPAGLLLFGVGLEQSRVLLAALVDEAGRSGEPETLVQRYAPLTVTPNCTSRIRLEAGSCLAVSFRASCILHPLFN